MQSYEVEIKALLGSLERAEEIRRSLKQADTSCQLRSKNKQLNHYFEPSTELGSGGGSLEKLAKVIASHLSDTANKELSGLVSRGAHFSVRSRDKDGEVLLVVKASVDDTTSENGIARIEFEGKVDMSLDMLDQLILVSGFRYQAKWSREREEYVCRGVNVTLDKNAGYGWLAEFERVVGEETMLEQARGEIRTLMEELAVEELPQERLERMFAFYNAHWPEYYGTERIFVVE